MGSSSDGHGGRLRHSARLDTVDRVEPRLETEPNAEEDDSMPPTKLAHVVFQTNRLKEMRDWYCAVLGGRVVYEDGHLSFVTYDDEHHRVAFIDFGPLAPRAEGAAELGVRPVDRPGVHHVAFTFGSMGELLDNYV